MSRRKGRLAEVSIFQNLAYVQLPPRRPKRVRWDSEEYEMSVEKVSERKERKKVRRDEVWKRRARIKVRRAREEASGSE